MGFASAFIDFNEEMDVGRAFSSAGSDLELTAIPAVRTTPLFKKLRRDAMKSPI
jgi:hypothetical protein